MATQKRDTCISCKYFASFSWTADGPSPDANDHWTLTIIAMVYHRLTGSSAPPNVGDR